MGRLGLWIQYAGLAVAMAGGAPWPRPTWWIVAVGIAIAAVGIVTKRVGDKRDPRLTAHGDADASSHAGSIPAANAALPKMLERVRKLAEGLTERPLAEIAAEIESIQQEGTERVAAAQDAFVHAYSFAAYATFMTPLASAERWLYRAWSAASDDHRPETIASVESALPYLEEALVALEALEKRA